MNPLMIGINETHPSDAHIMMQRIINAIVGMLFFLWHGLSPRLVERKNVLGIYRAI